MAWKYATGNLIYSSPAVVNNVVYIASEGLHNLLRAECQHGSDPVDVHNREYCRFFARRGKRRCVHRRRCGLLDRSERQYQEALLWKYHTGAEIFSSGPAVANGVVYVGSGYGNSVYALDASTGAFIWKYPTGAVQSSPAVANGVVYVGSMTPTCTP